jgi:hypothetical protein
VIPAALRDRDIPAVTPRPRAGRQFENAGGRLLRESCRRHNARNDNGRRLAPAHGPGPCPGIYRSQSRRCARILRICTQAPNHQHRTAWPSTRTHPSPIEFEAFVTAVDKCPLCNAVGRNRGQVGSPNIAFNVCLVIWRRGATVMLASAVHSKPHQRRVVRAAGRATILAHSQARMISVLPRERERHRSLIYRASLMADSARHENWRTIEIELLSAGREDACEILASSHVRNALDRKCIRARRGIGAPTQNGAQHA